MIFSAKERYPKDNITVLCLNELALKEFKLFSELKKMAATISSNAYTSEIRVGNMW